MFGTEAGEIERAGSAVFEQQLQCRNWPVISIAKIVMNPIWIFNLKQESFLMMKIIM
jgi:hypothetical protein